MTIRQILTKHWEGLSIDDKPVGVISGSTFEETDTGAIFITYDGNNWEVADERVRLTDETGIFIDIPAEFEDIVTAIEAV